jgi:hypothetical protein
LQEFIELCYKLRRCLAIGLGESSFPVEIGQAFVERP